MERLKSLEKNVGDSSERSLGVRIVKGSLWVLSLQVAARGIRFLSMLVLARILVPSDFGIFGIALLSVSFLETFLRLGLHAALVQKRGDIEEFFDTAWVMGLGRGLIICLALFFSAPLIANFFDSPKLIGIIQILSIAPLLMSMENVGMVFFTKRLDFRKLFLYEISGTLANVIVAVSLAIILRSVWALIYGLLARHFVNVFMSYVLHPYRPSLKFDWAKGKELFQYGKWMLGSGIILYFINQGDNAFVGKMFGTTALGYYVMAFNLSNLPATEITHVISRVMFPAYSKIQNDVKKLKEAYLKTLQVIALVSIPLAGMIFIFIGDFTVLVLGERWVPMVPVAQVLSIAGLFRSISASTGPLFNGVGKPYLVTKIVSIRLVILAACIYPFSSVWGLPGAGFAVLLSGMVVDPVALYLASRISQNNLSDIMKSLLVPLGNTILLMVAVTIFKDIFIHHFGIPGLVMIGLLCGVFYWSLSYLSEKLFDYKVVNLAKRLLLESASAR